MQKAENDLILAKHITTMVNIDIANACYHCQQCAEKALKAFLVYNNVKYRMIHDLDDLCFDCKNIDPDFKQISVNCNILNDYITHSRYPSSYVFVEIEMYESIKLAEEILDFVKAKTTP
jgi:HEPN domain-containing protein